jgi:hypothetical protein
VTIAFFARLSTWLGCTVACVPVEEHTANYRAARALADKGRNAGEGAAGLSKSSAKKGVKKSAVKKAKPKNENSTK